MLDDLCLQFVIPTMYVAVVTAPIIPRHNFPSPDRDDFQRLGKFTLSAEPEGVCGAVTAAVI